MTWVEGTLLRGQTALVTGAGGGIGAALAAGLAAYGAHVVIAGRTMATLNATCDAIMSAGGKATACRLDVADAGDCRAAASRMEREVGAVSLLVNNAGVIHYQGIDDPGVAEAWNDCIAINLTGAFNTALAFKEQLKSVRGSIVNIGSIAGFVYTTNTVGYSAAKGGVHMLTVALARELGPHGVRVNAVAPGPIDTHMAPASQDPECMKLLQKRVPLGRIGEPHELVGPVAFLASPMASYMTGHVMVVDGGFLTA